MSNSESPLGRPIGAKGEDTRRRIIAAAMQCVAERGYARATIREIARYASITSGSLYHYFPNKAEIVRATYLEVSEVAMPQLAAAAEQARGVVDKLVAVIDRGSQIMQDYPYAIPFDRAVRSPGVDDAALPKISESIFAEMGRIVAGVIQQADRDGELNATVTAAGATNAVFAVLRGLYDSGLSSPDEFHETVPAIRLLMRGTLLTGSKVDA
jgi:AcrR family transcriptional regulator